MFVHLDLLISQHQILGADRASDNSRGVQPRCCSRPHNLMSISEITVSPRWVILDKLCPGRKMTVFWMPVACCRKPQHWTAGPEPRSPILGRRSQSWKPWLGTWQCRHTWEPVGFKHHQPQMGLSFGFGDPGNQLSQTLHFVYRKIKEWKGIETVKFNLTSPLPALVLDFASHEKL